MPRRRPTAEPLVAGWWVADSRSCGLAGRVGCAGGAVNPQAGPAAGGCAFGRLRSNASQAKRTHPCRLGRAIHGAYAPAQPTGPATDSFRARSPRKIKKKSNSKAGRFARIHAWRGSTVQAWRGCIVSTKVDSYQQQRCAAICQGWGGVGLQDRWRHGWRHRAPMDGFTACPAWAHPPTRSRDSQRADSALFSTTPLDLNQC